MDKKMAEKQKKKNDTLSRLLPIVLILAGITLFGEGVSLLAAQSGYQKTSAVITEIAAEPYQVRGAEKKALTAFVTYTVGDTSYTADLGGVRSGFIEGGQIDVMVDPETPQDAVLPSTAGGVVCTVIGAVLLLGGGIWITPLLREVFRKKGKQT